jgi:hypothetical protein
MPRTALLISALLAAGTTFYDGAGRVTGSARTDEHGVVHFYDPAGRGRATAHTDEHGVIHFYDPAGRSTGTARPKE